MAIENQSPPVSEAPPTIPEQDILDSDFQISHDQDIAQADAIERSISDYNDNLKSTNADVVADLASVEGKTEKTQTPDIQTTMDSEASPPSEDAETRKNNAQGEWIGQRTKLLTTDAIQKTQAEYSKKNPDVKFGPDGLPTDPAHLRAYGAEVARIDTDKIRVNATKDMVAANYRTENPPPDPTKDPEGFAKWSRGLQEQQKLIEDTKAEVTKEVTAAIQSEKKSGEAKAASSSAGGGPEAKRLRHRLVRQEPQRARLADEPGRTV